MLGTFFGALPFFSDAVTGTVQQLKASGVSQLYALRLLNTTGAAAYLQVFFKASAAVTLGTTVPDFVVRLGANESIYLPFPMPLQAANGLSIAGTTTPTGLTGAAISVGALFQ